MFFFLMIRLPPRSTQSRSSAASDVYRGQIVGSEYIFNILPKGTHEFNKFIKPSALASYVRNGNAEMLETKGMFYNPLTHKANLNNDLGVNYMMYARKP